MRLTIPSPTERQQEYAADLQRKLGISDGSLDQHCRAKFGRPYQEMHRAQMTLVINELMTWREAPAEMRRAQGQQDLPGFEAEP